MTASGPGRIGGRQQRAVGDAAPAVRTRECWMAPPSAGCPSKSTFACRQPDGLTSLSPRAKRTLQQWAAAALAFVPAAGARAGVIAVLVSALIQRSASTRTQLHKSLQLMLAAVAAWQRRPAPPVAPVGPALRPGRQRAARSGRAEVGSARPEVQARPIAPLGPPAPASCPSPPAHRSVARASVSEKSPCPAGRVADDHLGELCHEWAGGESLEGWLGPSRWAVVQMA